MFLPCKEGETQKFGIIKLIRVKSLLQKENEPDFFECGRENDIGLMP